MLLQSLKIFSFSFAAHYFAGSKKLVCSLPPGAPAYKMVRYFENPFEDYKPGSPPVEIREVLIQRIDETVQNITKRLLVSKKYVDGGLYVGVTGIAFMFYRLSKNPLLSDRKGFYIDKALEYLEPALESSAGDKTSFLLGDAGTYALATVLFTEIGKKQASDTIKVYKSLFNSYLNPKFLKCGGDEFFVGRTGYLAGVLWMTKELRTVVMPKIDLHKLCDIILMNGQNYAIKQNSPCPLMYHYYNTKYIGAAHGLSFILQMLLSVPGYIEQNLEASVLIQETTKYICSLQNAEGNWPCCMEDIEDHKLVHWCHGAPGTIYLMAKAYLRLKDQRYYEACVQAGELVWNKGLLRKGPGICHGVAGNGYVFLLLYRLTGNEKYLYRAAMFADFMYSDEFVRDARLPDNPESLYEGTAGTLCYLSDLLIPDKAEFIFQDVFTDYSTFYS